MPPCSLAKGPGVTTYHIYDSETFQYLGTVDAADEYVAGQLAHALWACPLTVLTWRLTHSSHIPA
jgi:hypothetical protein